MTEFRMLPFSSRLTRSNSRLPSSMVMRRWLLGILGEQPGHDGSLAGTRGTGDAYTDAVPNTGHQKMKHLSRGAAGIQKFLFRDRLLVDDTDGGIDANIRVHDRWSYPREIRMFLSRNPTTLGIVSSMTMPQALSIRRTINGVLRRRKTYPDLDAAAAGLDHLNVIVGIEVNSLRCRVCGSISSKRSTRPYLHRAARKDARWSAR